MHCDDSSGATCAPPGAYWPAAAGSADSARCAGLDDSGQTPPARRRRPPAPSRRRRRPWLRRPATTTASSTSPRLLGPATCGRRLRPDHRADRAGGPRTRLDTEIECRGSALLACCWRRGAPVRLAHVPRCRPAAAGAETPGRPAGARSARRRGPRGVRRSTSSIAAACPSRALSSRILSRRFSRSVSSRSTSIASTNAATDGPLLCAHCTSRCGVQAA
jgi:hypothetical protein